VRPVLNMFQQERSLLLFTHTAFALPSAPRLLLWLFLSNLGWFMALACIYGAQIQKNNGMHLENDTECTALSSTIFCFMTFSVLWPSIICFDLLQNTRDPRWRWVRADVCAASISFTGHGSFFALILCRIPPKRLSGRTLS
jgi:hypothetical protein